MRCLWGSCAEEILFLRRPLRTTLQVLFPTDNFHKYPKTHLNIYFFLFKNIDLFFRWLLSIYMTVAVSYMKGFVWGGHCACGKVEQTSLSFSISVERIPLPGCSPPPESYPISTRKGHGKGTLTMGSHFKSQHWQTYVQIKQWRLLTTLKTNQQQQKTTKPKQ